MAKSSRPYKTFKLVEHDEDDDDIKSANQLKEPAFADMPEKIQSAAKLIWNLIKDDVTLENDSLIYHAPYLHGRLLLTSGSIIVVTLILGSNFQILISWLLDGKSRGERSRPFDAKRFSLCFY